MKKLVLLALCAIIVILPSCALLGGSGDPAIVAKVAKAEAKPAEAKPETKPEAKPAKPKPEAKPAEAKPEAKPVKDLDDLWQRMRGLSAKQAAKDGKQDKAIAKILERVEKVEAKLGELLEGKKEAEEAPLPAGPQVWLDKKALSKGQLELGVKGLLETKTMYGAIGEKENFYFFVGKDKSDGSDIIVILDKYKGKDISPQVDTASIPANGAEIKIYDETGRKVPLPPGGKFYWARGAKHHKIVVGNEGYAVILNGNVPARNEKSVFIQIGRNKFYFRGLKFYHPMVPTGAPGAKS